MDLQKDVDHFRDQAMCKIKYDQFLHNAIQWCVDTLIDWGISRPLPA